MKLITCLYFPVFIFVLLLSSCRSGQDTQSRWVGPPNEEADGPGLYMFTNTLELDSVPPNMLLDISADTRYQLYVNGYLAGLGPQNSSQGNWKYDSYNISSLLQPGENLVSAAVYYFGEHAGRAMITEGPALWSRLESDQDPDFSSSWKVSRAEGVFFNRMKQGKDIRGGFLTPSMDSVVDNERPHYWNYPEGQIRDQSAAVNLPDTSHYGEIRERTIRYLEMQMERFREVTGDTDQVEDLLVNAGSFTFRVPSNRRVKILLDNQVLTTSYPFLLYSGGEEGRIKITYAEALYTKEEDKESWVIDKERQWKGNRNVTHNKQMSGHYDLVFPDGGDNRLYFPSWFRVFRYIELEITTGDDPLVIHDYHSNFTAYPFDELAVFDAGDPHIDNIRSTAWRTMRLCSWETFMDCPYYEQLQYVGDTRIQSLVSLYGSGDPLLMKNAINQFRLSMGDDSLTLAAFPSQGGTLIPPFSLFWTLMIRDYYYLVGDDEFVFQMIPEMKKVLEWHAGFLNAEQVLEKVDHWNFVDWPVEWAWDPERGTGGMPPGAQNGISSVINLQYSWVLRELAPLFRDAGDPSYADLLGKRSDQINRGIKTLCWSDERKLLADSPAGKSFSQHANIMAVLSGCIAEKESADFISRVALDKELIQATVYYRFYLNRALEKTGRGDLYLQLLGPWETMLELGLTTFAERPEPTRSDCHGWSASPHYEFLALVAGIRPDAPGFSRVMIKPSPGYLSRFTASVPHPGGQIDLEFDKEKETARVRLPDGVNGVFTFGEYTEDLNPGVNNLKW